MCLWCVKDFRTSNDAANLSTAASGIKISPRFISPCVTQSASSTANHKRSSKMTMTAEGTSLTTAPTASPLPTRNPMPLSASQEGQVRDIYYARVRGFCAEEIRRLAHSPPGGLPQQTNSEGDSLCRMRTRTNRHGDMGVPHRTRKHEQMHGFARNTRESGRCPRGVVSAEDGEEEVTTRPG